MPSTEELQALVMPCSWALLEPHAAREAMWLVCGVDLAVAGAAIASDETTTVQAWIEKGSLRRPTREELTEWERAPVAFEALIVQPFVLARAMDAPA